MNPRPPSLAQRLLELLHNTRDSNDPAVSGRLNDLLRYDSGARAAIARQLVDEQALINCLRQDELSTSLDLRPLTPSSANSPMRLEMRLIPHLVPAT